MDKIYRGQSALRISVRTFCGLEDIRSAVIKYRKPDGTEGQFTAGVSDPIKGVISHECIEHEIDQSGWWAFWAFITFTDGRAAAGETAEVFVWNEGK